MQPAEQSPQPRRNAGSTRLRKMLSSGGPLIGLLAVFMFFAALAPSAFHSANNIKTMLLHSVIVSVGALGMTFIIIGGGIDLSAGSVVALSMVITAKVLDRFGLGQPGPVLALFAALAGMATGALCGFVNGLVITRLRLAPFIATLGMMEIARGIAKWLASSSAVYPPATWLNALMQQDPTWPWHRIASGTWIMIAAVFAVHIILRYTVFGRYVFAIGSNEQTARLCGIPVKTCQCIIYSLAGLLIGLSGVLYYGNLSAGDSTEAMGMELQIIAAVVIGGASLSGGEGSAAGTLIGALIMVVLANGCTMLGVPMYVQNLIVGVVIIAAVALDRLKGRYSS